MAVFNFLKSLLGVKKKKKKSTKKRSVKKVTKKKKPSKKKDLKQSKRRPKKKAAPKRTKKIKKKPEKKPIKKAPARSAKKVKQKPQEKEIGIITHYYNKISVGVIKLKANLSIGDTIHIKGAHDDFVQRIRSMQVNRQDVSFVRGGLEAGIKVKHPVHANDKVYKV